MSSAFQKLPPSCLHFIKQNQQSYWKTPFGQCNLFGYQFFRSNEKLASLKTTLHIGCDCDCEPFAFVFLQFLLKYFVSLYVVFALQPTLVVIVIAGRHWHYLLIVLHHSDR